jgi:hypothetical protein
MADSKRAKSKAAATAGDATGASKWQKALDPTAEWEKVRPCFRASLREYVCLPALSRRLQTELHEVVYWLRQVLGVLCGVVWGVIPLTGYVGNLAYAPTDPRAFFPSSWLVGHCAAC